MANPLYKQYGQSQMNPQMMQMKKAFNQFRNTFKGDPKQEVMKLLQSGQITQEQLNEVQAIANQLGTFLS